MHKENRNVNVEEIEDCSVGKEAATETRKTRGKKNR
jgi:hypothetical protein